MDAYGTGQRKEMRGTHRGTAHLSVRGKVEGTPSGEGIRKASYFTKMCQWEDHTYQRRLRMKH